MAWEVTTGLVTQPHPPFVLSPSRPASSISNSLLVLCQLLAQVFGFPVFLATSERDLINPKSCNSSGAQAAKLGMLSGGASSLQSFGGAAQRRVGTGVPVQRRLQRPPPPPSPGIRAAPRGETCTLKWLIVSLPPPEPPGLEPAKLHPGTVFSHLSFIYG